MKPAKHAKGVARRPRPTVSIRLLLALMLSLPVLLAMLLRAISATFSPPI